MTFIDEFNYRSELSEPSSLPWMKMEKGIATILGGLEFLDGQQKSSKNQKGLSSQKSMDHINNTAVKVIQVQEANTPVHRITHLTNDINSMQFNDNQNIFYPRHMATNNEINHLPFYNRNNDDFTFKEPAINIQYSDANNLMSFPENNIEFQHTAQDNFLHPPMQPTNIEYPSHPDLNRNNHDHYYDFPQRPRIPVPQQNNLFRESPPRPDTEFDTIEL